MALVESMDVAAEQEQQQQQATAATAAPATAAATAVGALSSWSAPAHQGQVEPQPGQDEEDQGRQHSPIQRVDTPCPAALRRHLLQGDSRTQQGGSFVLLPDERGSRRFIPLEAGQTTVVSRISTGRSLGRGGEGRGGTKVPVLGVSRERYSL